ncbi:GIY-YIG catalytic domain-containing endonuclease [Sinorhizobium phage phiN3]|uniref:GIY-YIG catalytic domain-containing endonuclease n=1 Tax=Sinorhizobium phage phiN3 TaxID=1647405 RepID=A0A0F6YP98_9CAUD|nr:homing endonuclease [Sinorhizobium phage phiN3]AKF13312.1 GIY-YIG catalytic domain-containing endonuclease [Sinorhizobium phage phiN3]
MNYIYLLVNRVNCKVYVGVTNNYDKRMREHSYGRYGIIGRAVKKYGWENFDSYILAETEDRELEKFYIALFSSKNRDCGYNQTDGGEGSLGYDPSPDTRAKMRAAKVGRKMSEDHRRKISESNTGRKVSEETRTKIAERLKGNRNFEGHTFSEETKKVLSDQKSKHYTVVSPDGVKIDIFNMRKFCFENNLTPSAMSLVIQGKKPHHKGWTIPSD